MSLPFTEAISATVMSKNVGDACRVILDLELFYMLKVCTCGRSSSNHPTCFQQGSYSATKNNYFEKYLSFMLIISLKDPSAAKS